MTKKHDQRTIIVLTRVSESELHATYCNALTDDEPYVMTVVRHDPPFAGFKPEDVPEVGTTKATWT